MFLFLVVFGKFFLTKMYKEYFLYLKILFLNTIIVYNRSLNLVVERLVEESLYGHRFYQYVMVIGHISEYDSKFRFNLDKISI